MCNHDYMKGPSNYTCKMPGSASTGVLDFYVCTHRHRTGGEGGSSPG